MILAPVEREMGTSVYASNGGSPSIQHGCRSMTRVLVSFAMDFEFKLKTNEQRERVEDKFDFEGCKVG